MSELVTRQINQILLKPNVDVVLNDANELTEEYMLALQEALEQQEQNVTLDYVRLMSGGVHVLSIVPPVSVLQSQQLTDVLTDREDVEYAESDSPRRR